MSALEAHVQDYLRLRRALGFKLKPEGRLLPQLVAYLDAVGASTLTSELAIAWARLPAGVQPIQWAHRLSAARAFAAYLKTIEPATEVPPADVFGARQRRRTPYLWASADVCRLLDATRALRPPLRAATYETLFGLLAVSGMRVGEAISLDTDDVDLDAGVLTIHEAKLRRVRLVPLHLSSSEALRRYATERDRLCPRPRSTAFFLSTVGITLEYSCVWRTFAQLSSAIGVRSTSGVQPRIHDLRHSFAVSALIGWQRAGVDVGEHVAVLSNYLGHVGPAGTYWYLSAAPELMGLAAERLDDRYGARR
jgi:integrase/recombinase XerD